MNIRNSFFSLSSFFLIAMAVGCGGSSDSSSESGGGTDTGTSDTNALSSAYPGDLAVASPTASSSSSSSLVTQLLVKGGKSVQVVNEPPLEKIEDIDNLINAADETTFQSALSEMKNKIDITATAPNANCYGPTLNYTDHSDASGGQPNDGQLPSGDLGVWIATESSTGEACVAAKMNNIIGQFENLVNAGTQTVAATLGAANLGGIVEDLPVAGASLDMTSTANDAFSENSVPMNLDTATIERETENTTEGDPVFTTTIEGSAEDSTGASVADFSGTLTHIPTGEASSAALKSQTAEVNNDTYCGRLVQSFNISQTIGPTLGNCAGSEGTTRCTLVEYCKDSETSLTYHLRTAEFCGLNKDCGDVDPSDKVGGTNTDGWGNNFYYTICHVNPQDGSGSCAQAWQAGANDGNTRVLNVKVNEGGESGCGYFGFGPDVAATSGVGSINRMICNWAGPGNSHTGVTKAQRQCFTRDSTGKFVSDASNLAITYAPTNDCNKSGTGTFTYSVPDDATTTVSASTAVTNSLINLTDVDFTVPSLPVIPE